jgi:hypothetical protein
LYCDTPPPWFVDGAHAQTRAFPVLTRGCCDTKALVPPESTFLVGGYGEIENEIDNLDNLDNACTPTPTKTRWSWSSLSA